MSVLCSELVDTTAPGFVDLMSIMSEGTLIHLLSLFLNSLWYKLQILQPGKSHNLEVTCQKFDQIKNRSVNYITRSI